MTVMAKLIMPNDHTSTMTNHGRYADLVVLNWRFSEVSGNRKKEHDLEKLVIEAGSS